MKKAFSIVVFVLVMGFFGSAYALNYALMFDGVNDFVTIPDSNSLDLSSGMTIEAWIKSSSTDGPRVIVSKWSDPLYQYSYVFKDHNYGDKLRIETSPGDYSDFSSLRGDTSIVINNWIHVATTYDSNTIKLYYNGELDGSNPLTAPINNTVTELLVGAINGNGWDGLESFSGIIDEVRIWNYARTGEQLDYWKNYSLKGSESGLVGYWNFDEGSSQIVHDLSIYANNGRFGSALEIDTNDPSWVISDSPVVAVVPEPASMLLLGIGSLAMAVLKRKKKLI